jgi:hypothetical protein
LPISPINDIVNDLVPSRKDHNGRREFGDEYDTDQEEKNF